MRKNKGKNKLIKKRVIFLVILIVIIIGSYSLIKNKKDIPDKNLMIDVVNKDINTSKELLDKYKLDI